jgi:hypothetical protein
VEGIKAGRLIEPPLPPDVYELDDTDTDSFLGSYDVRSGLLTKEHCGPNFPKRHPKGS